MSRQALIVFLAVASSLLFAACGGGERDTAVDAREENNVRIDGLRYRVHLFRELNPNAEPDDGLIDRPAPSSGHAFYMALLRVCNDAGARRTAVGDIHLEDAFGNRFAPLRAGVDDELAYDARTLSPGRCLPARDSSAARTFDGAALVFDLPLDAVQRRPLVLVIGDARIELDL